MSSGECRRFRDAYARHRAAEGRGGLDPDRLLALPKVEPGTSRAEEWAVRARSYGRFERSVFRAVMADCRPRLPRALDLGAGSGWLSHRLGRLGAWSVALDLRVDRVDGLGAGGPFRAARGSRFQPVAASFDALPFADGTFDLAVFNASLHYAVDLAGTLAEAERVVRSGGRLAVLDSPFYRTAGDGEAMVAEKRASARETFGALADALTAIPFVEYLTPECLDEASRSLGLAWRRHRALPSRLRAARIPGPPRRPATPLPVRRVERARPVRSPPGAWRRGGNGATAVGAGGPA